MCGSVTKVFGRNFRIIQDCIELLKRGLGFIIIASFLIGLAKSFILCILVKGWSLLWLMDIIVLIIAGIIIFRSGLRNLNEYYNLKYPKKQK